MPEYLAPGVFVEEVSFRAKSIEGVATSTTGMAGMARFGPVRYMRNGNRGPLATDPRLITSFTEFERVYGGLEPLKVEGDERVNYLAHAARAFFLNGGRRLYVSRVHSAGAAGAQPAVAAQAVALGAGDPPATWRARWPGEYGNVVVTVRAKRSKNLAFTYPASDVRRAAWGVQAQRAKHGALVEIVAPPLPAEIPSGDDPLVADRLALVQVDRDGRQTFVGGPGNPPAGSIIQLVELQVEVADDSDRRDRYDFLGVHPWHKRYIGKVLQLDDPADENALVWLDWPEPAADPADPAPSRDLAVALAVALVNNPNPRLTGGGDGVLIAPDDLRGEAADPDDAERKATGLEALAEIDDIAIVAAPDTGTMATPVDAARVLVDHADSVRYRIAVVDGPPLSSISEIREFRGNFDSTHAALYHPWIQVLDPLLPPATGAPPPLVSLPPSGFVCGIYARTDVERGVFKAPANEIVRGLSRFEANINTGRQEVLNPEGINALRFFEGRGNRVWGARTMTSDPEWKYVPVRRLFNYLEASIDRSTQWAVFEPNDSRLWTNLRLAIESFLYTEWRNGALMGDEPAEAFFVRCDETTMTQNDLDNGRLICLIGVAPVKPAEFVIFRIGQWTADASIV